MIALAAGLAGFFVGVVAALAMVAWSQERAERDVVSPQTIHDVVAREGRQ